MTTARSSINPALKAFTALAAMMLAEGPRLVAQEPAAEADATELKWTPHRASRPAVEVAEPPAEPAFERPQAPAASAPAASVSLPDGVPPAASLPARADRGREAAYVPPRRQAPQATTPSFTDAVKNFYDPGNPDAVLGIPILRTPRGPVSRPILAPEGQQAQAMRAAADRAALGDARLGGGIAPRYDVGRAAAAGRPERLAMNVDGIPSVMRQAPSEAAPAEPLPGAAAPGVPEKRLPPPPPADGQQSLSETETIGPGIELPGDYGMEPGSEFIPDASPELAGDPGVEGGLLMGEYPTQLHIESFYDDPYACEDDECLLPMSEHHGRICTWLRRFGRPYYGWRWYRDFTASAGITSFTNAIDLGINGNFGTNEYLNWSMPFWNAFGVGWQVGWRGTQTNFQPASIEVGTTTLSKNARDQQFVTTGFFTRAFEGRGLQGGAVYDYLHDSWLDNTDVSQLRYELSYVWGYHELGFWGASNIGDQTSLFGPVRRVGGTAGTLDLYTGFYRVQFGDANEWKFWGGGTGEGDGIVGSLVRAPMHKSLALEGTFTYVIPGRNQVINLDNQGEASSFSPSAWNVAVNVVWYPAGRSRRSLSSPYRPLFEVADNGSMIRSIQPFLP
jgi:hypothetical protein